MTFRTLIYSVLLVLCVSSTGVRAQTEPFTPPSRSDGHVHVTLTVARPGTPTMLLRRSGSGPRNVILLDPANLTPESLSNAVAGLLIAEAMDPEGRQRSDRTAQRTALSRPAPVFPWAQEAVRRFRVLADSRGATRRSLQIWVAPMRRTRA